MKNSGYRFAKTDLKSGTRFDRLVVIKFSHNGRSDRCRYYLCKCDCGNEIRTRGKNLTEKRTRSCGCLSKENLKNRKIPDNYALKNRVIKGYRYAAKTRKLDFNLSREDICSIIAMDCYYCGSKPTNKVESKDGRILFYNGIDRIDTNKGYYLDNCVPCCRECNTGKFDKTPKEFINWICRVYDFYAKKNKVNTVRVENSVKIKW